MSTVSRQPCHDLPSSEGRAPRARIRLTLSWSIPRAPGSRSLLEITIEGESARASLVDDGRRTTLAGPTPVALIFEPEHNLWHADAPALIAATWRQQDGGPPQVLFARTPLLQKLGIPGGTAELARPDPP